MLCCYSNNKIIVQILKECSQNDKVCRQQYFKNAKKDFHPQMFIYLTNCKETSKFSNRSFNQEIVQICQILLQTLKLQSTFSFADADALVSTGRKGLIKFDPVDVIWGKHENPWLCKPWFIYFYPLMKIYCFQRS